MVNTDSMPTSHPRLRTPSGPARPGQPWWNRQRTSSMPNDRYVREGAPLAGEPLERSWVGQSLDSAPLWTSVDLRDGNQALANPMSLRRKAAMFDLLVKMGFKEIEVGYPSASETDFGFVRHLITQDKVPDDVTISVFTPARSDLITRTFDSLEGVRNGMVHLCLATACLWREVVFQMSADEVRKLTIDSAEQVARLADAMPGSGLRLEYSPEAFNVTEPELALTIANEVTTTWDACADRPVVVNLPSTVETEYPTTFADQIAWMDRNLSNRESVILSIHPHNDRGTAVAAAELALMAGAVRVEGTLFGNGERTGNVCLATLALNLFSRGVDAQLDFSDIDDIRSTVEYCNQIPVHVRHPYAGDLVYTAFSGTHQDAIAKGLAALEEKALDAGQPAAAMRWHVPYLPIDPHDVGRAYESVIRLNSQSGKGGIAHVLKSKYGLDLPRELRIDFSKVIQKITDESGVEINSRQLWEAFRSEYLEPSPSIQLAELACTDTERGICLDALLTTAGGKEVTVCGTGENTALAFADALAQGGWLADVRTVVEHPLGDRTAAYALLTVKGCPAWGAAVDATATGATARAVLAAVNRALRFTPHA
jgi:2-isopropylmalate synthase